MSFLIFLCITFTFNLPIFLQLCVDFNVIMYIQVQLHIVVAIATETRRSEQVPWCTRVPIFLLKLCSSLTAYTLLILILDSSSWSHKQGAISRDHFWSICTYPFSTKVGLNGRLLVPNLVDLVSL